MARHRRTAALGSKSKSRDPGRFERYAYDALIARDKASLDLFWLRDESLEDADNLPPLDLLATEIAEDLEAALAESLASTAESE